MKRAVTHTILVLFVVLFATLTFVFVSLYIVEKSKKNDWDVSISPCMSEDNQDVCGTGIQSLQFSCPTGKCSRKPKNVSQPCVSNKACSWQTQNWTT